MRIITQQNVHEPLTASDIAEYLRQFELMLARMRADSRNNTDDRQITYNS